MKAKKVLALALAGAMVFSLAACGSSTTTSTDTAEDTTSVAEVEEVEEVEEAEEADFTWNEQYEVWAILPTTGVPGLLVHADTMGYIMEKYGFTYSAKDASQSSETQLIQDAIAAGNVGCLMIATSDKTAIETDCLEAAEAGIAIVFLGADPETYTIASAVVTAYSTSGYLAVQAAADWLENRVAEGGDIPTLDDGTYAIALDTYYDIVDGIYRSNAMWGAATEAGFTVVNSSQAYGDSYQEDAYSNAMAVLAANPDCRIFIAYEPDGAMGISSYISTYAADNGLDLADFCIISCYAEDPTFYEMYANAEADASSEAIKGYATYGITTQISDDDISGFEDSSYTTASMGASTTGGNIAYLLLSACNLGGYDWTYGQLYYDEIYAVNVYGSVGSWASGDENPAAEYEETSAMFE